MSIIVKDNGEEEAFTEKRMIINVITFVCLNNDILKRYTVISDFSIFTSYNSLQQGKNGLELIDLRFNYKFFAIISNNILKTRL